MGKNRKGDTTGGKIPGPHLTRILMPLLHMCCALTYIHVTLHLLSRLYNNPTSIQQTDEDSRFSRSTDCSMKIHINTNNSSPQVPRVFRQDRKLEFS